MQAFSSMEQLAGGKHKPSHPTSDVFHARPLLKEQELARSEMGRRCLRDPLGLH